ncbi:hypothetical protein E2C01_070326 [Portunus trituberculatus]|uniref:Uncharacterized protein n=1 Tax=Portunus trituberculatus TaxID=210409 RepID=A0A5B7I1T2_PORTR|nr:hypothetical protein [Portunus trituberculatus]
MTYVVAVPKIKTIHPSTYCITLPALRPAITTLNLPSFLVASGIHPSWQPAVLRLTCAFLKKTGQLPCLRYPHKTTPGLIRIQKRPRKSRATSGNPRDPEGGNGTPSDVMSVLLGNDIENSDENEDSDVFLLRQKKVKITVLILIVIWETETNPHSDVHTPPHIFPSSNALVCPVAD